MRCGREYTQSGNLNPVLAKQRLAKQRTIGLNAAQTASVRVYYVSEQHTEYKVSMETLQVMCVFAQRILICLRRSVRAHRPRPAHNQAPPVASKCTH